MREANILQSVQRARNFKIKFIFFLILLLLLTGCSTPTPEEASSITVNVLVDNEQKIVKTLPGTSVKIILDSENINLGALDKVSPPLYSEINEPVDIQVIRVTEEFQSEDSLIAFETQTIKNETLPEGQTFLVQAGVNGVLQITHRILYENGIETSKSVFKTDVIQEAIPEIVMVGVQTPFTSISIPGKLAYLTSGNAWIMEETTGSRRPLVTSADLDGRVFSLSPSGDWLLFSRSAEEGNEDVINTLWMIDTTSEDAKPIDLRIQNIVHFADWVPGRGITISYSTVEIRSAAPGWQANNDLLIKSFNGSGVIIGEEEIIPANSGGIYGWWGTEFSWSPDGDQLAYARPDSVGWVDFENQEFVPVLNLTPFQTLSDWAWVPGIGWTADHSLLYTTIHQNGSEHENGETSPYFDLVAVNFANNGAVFNLITQTGMFAYPVPSRFSQNNTFQVAYLQAIFPEKSDSSRYRLVLMDQDSSNKDVIFPEEGSPGLEPQEIVWGPAFNTKYLAFIYQDNLWLLDTASQKANQITGDSSIQKIDWK